jgi:hypothetical protein
MRKTALSSKYRLSFEVDDALSISEQVELRTEIADVAALLIAGPR